MGQISDRNLNPVAGDTPEVTLRKILQVLRNAKYPEGGDVSVIVPNVNRPQGETESGGFDFIKLDSLSRALVTVTNEHHEIHEGNHFVYSNPNTIGSSASIDWLITSPAAPVTTHLVFQADGIAVTSVFFYEGSDKTGTAAQTVFNSNRASLNTALTTVHKGVSGGTTDGTLLFSYASGAATGGIVRSPSAAGREFEFILQPATKYLLRITSGTASNLTNLFLRWYEETSQDI